MYSVRHTITWWFNSIWHSWRIRNQITCCLENQIRSITWLVDHYTETTQTWNNHLGTQLPTPRHTWTPSWTARWWRSCRRHVIPELPHEPRGGDPAADATSYLNSLTKLEVIVAVVTTQFTLSYLRPLLISLQSFACDLIEAHAEASVFSAAEILLGIYQNAIHLNGARWRTRFWTHREIRRRKKTRKFCGQVTRLTWSMSNSQWEPSIKYYDVVISSWSHIGLSWHEYSYGVQRFSA